MLIVLGILEALGGIYVQDKRSKTDRKIELVCLFTSSTFVQPAVFLEVVWIGKIFFPSHENHFIDLSIDYQILAFLLLVDLTQYLWHRLSHQNRLMWKLHRLHHAVEEMRVLVTFRNTVLFYAFMPGIWFSSTMVFLGMGYVYFILFTHQIRGHSISTQHHQMGSNFYQYKILSPLAWIKVG